MRPVLLTLLLVACLQPVGETTGPRVTQCRGACPAGECSECAPVDPGCQTQECELSRFSCSKSKPCDAYDGVDPLPKTGGAYCVTFDQGGGTWAVDSTGAHACGGDPRPNCDGGMPRDAGACAPCVRRMYCIGDG